jgi:hypothetical protein
MSNLDIDNIQMHQNEPKSRKGMSGFLSVPSVGMRLAPETLILELFRDSFYRIDRKRQTKNAELEPDQRNDENLHLYTQAEQAVIASLRGRRKQTKRMKNQVYYAPAYPTLAKDSWLSHKRERIIVRLLFQGALSQHLWSKGESVSGKREEQAVLVDTMLDAFIGSQVQNNHSTRPKDILGAAISDRITAGLDMDVAREILLQNTDPSSTVFHTDKDEFASRIAQDFIAVCKLESKISRTLWIKIIMSFLRFSLPMWLLGHMQITCLVHGWLLDSMTNGIVPDEDHLAEKILARNQQILKPTLTPSRELFNRIGEYVRCRVETNVLLYFLEQIDPTSFENKKITLTLKNSSSIPLAEALLKARDCMPDIVKDPIYQGSPNLQTFLSRISERFRAWRDPLNKGQGKNIDEFLRVLYKAETGDEAGGHLLIRKGWGIESGFRVFPGKFLLQIVCFLAAKAKQNETKGIAGGGKVVLEDIEHHFAQYGISFSQAADARPMLMQELQALGLLAGSPDAGNSVAVINPF